MKNFLFLFAFTLFVYEIRSYPECPVGAVNDGKLCYKRLPDPWESSFDEAELACNLTYGGNLARIENAYASSLVNQLACSADISTLIDGARIYVGARNINNTWVQPDGSPLPYLNWEEGEPKLTPGYECAMMESSGGCNPPFAWKWFAFRCDDHVRNICSFPMKK